MNLETYQPVTLTYVNEEPRIDTYTVSERLGNVHESTYRLVTEYLDDFERFGRVRFEIRPLQTRGGKQQTKFALLNENQAYLLLMYSRNSAEARELKMALVQAFSEARQLYKPKSTLDLAEVMLGALRKQEVRLESLENTTEQVNAQLASIMTDSDFFTVKAYARLAGAKLDRRTALALGKRASKLCRESGVSIGMTLDETFGRINSYPTDVLEQAFEEAHLPT